MMGKLVGKSPSSGVMLVRISSFGFFSVLFLVTPSPWLLGVRKRYIDSDCRYSKGSLWLRESGVFTAYHEVSVYEGIK